MNNSSAGLSDNSPNAAQSASSAPPSSRGRKIRGWLITLGALGLAGGGLAMLAGKSRMTDKTSTPAKSTQPTTVMVTTDRVTVRPVQRKVGVVGSLWGRDEIAITPKVEGKIVKIGHDVGDVVRPGDVLLEIDETDFRLAVQEAFRSLELELAKLGLKVAPPQMIPAEADAIEREIARLGIRDLPPANFELTKLPSVVKALAQERNAIARRDRLNRLTGAAKATVEEKDQAETEAVVATAASKQAIFEAETTVAAVRLKRAALETALQRLIDTKVIVPSSPAAGAKIVTSRSDASIEYQVAKRTVSAGEKVHAGPNANPVFRLVVADPLKLVVMVPERHLREIKPGQDVELFVESHPDEPFHGKVTRVNPTVDRTSRTFEVEVLIPNADRQLHAGSFVTGSILTHLDGNALTIPEEALVQAAGVTSVFVLRDGHAVEVPVETGARIALPGGKRDIWWVEVRGKLQPGEAIITSGQIALAHGTPATVRPTSIKARGAK